MPRRSRGFAGTWNATKSAAGNFVCVMGGSPLSQQAVRTAVSPPRIEAGVALREERKRLKQKRWLKPRLVHDRPDRSRGVEPAVLDATTKCRTLTFRPSYA